MKRTLALLIAVLMVVAMLPLSTFAAAGQAIVGAPAPQGNQAATQGSSGAQQTPPAPTSNDYFAVYDENNAWVGYYATLAEADAALEDGYTLKILQSYTASATYTWGKTRADKAAPIRYTVDGALAEGGNAVITVSGEKAEYAWFFEKASVGDQVTLKNITMVAERGAIRVETGNSLMTMDLALENCKLYAGNSYYEVNAAAYAQQPATNDYRAVEANNLSLTVRGEQTVLRATEGEALAVQNGGVLIENGYFYSSAAAMTVLVVDATLVVDDAVVVNNEGVALGAASSKAFLRGGIFAVTDGAVAAIYAVDASSVLVTDALAVAGEEAYAFAAEEDAMIEILGAGVAVTDEALKAYGAVLAVPFAGATSASDESVVTIVGEGTAEAPEHQIAVSVQETITLNAPADTALRVYDAQGDLIAYLPADVSVNAENLVASIMLVPNGGKLVLDANIAVGETVVLPHLFPEVAITVEGAEGDPASIFGAVNGYLLYSSNSMDITLSNVELKNTLGKGVYFGSDDNVGLSAKDATLTLGEDSGVIAAEGEALYIASGAAVKLEQNAFVQSAALAVGENAVVVIEGGAAFEMNGDGTSVIAPVVQGASALLSREVTHSVTVGTAEDAKTYAFSFSENVVALNGGMIALPGVLSSLHQIIGENAAPQVTLSHEVELVVNVGAEPFHFNNNEEAVELLDETGRHVGYYGGIAAAIADVKDGYTVKLLADHVEVAAIKTALEEIDWTLDGNDKKLYMPEVNHLGMEFGGKNTTARIENLTLYAGGRGIVVNPATVKDGVGVIANNVFVYASGSDADFADAFVGDPVGVSAFHVTNEGGELIIIGDSSGAYVNGQYLEGTRLLFNEGYLSVYGGKYQAPVSRLVETAWSTSTTYIAAGEFIGGEGVTHTIYNRASAVTMLMGGNFVAKTGNMFFASSGSVLVYGGDFYHLSDATVVYNNTSYVSYYGGLVYFKDADAAQTFAQKAKMMSARQLDEAGSYTTAEKELLYGVNVGTALVTQGFQENTIWMEENEYEYGEYTMWSYTGHGEDRFGVYGTDLALALKLVGPYNGKVELLENVDKIHSAQTASRVMGPIAQVTLTSATEEHLTYASSKYSGTGTGDGYFLRLYGGTWILKNLTLANYGSQLLSVESGGLSYATMIIAEGGELSGHTSVVLLSNNTGLIVEEGGFANVSPLKNPSASYADKNRLPASSNIVRLAGSADVTVYGSLGYYRDGSIPTSGAYRCINYNGDTSYIAGTGEQCTIYLASTAKLASPVGSKSLPLVNLAITDNSVAYDILLTAEAGASFTTDASVLNATAGAQVVFDDVVIQNTTPAEDGSFTGGNYAFQMNGAGGVFKNMKYYGTKFMTVDSKGMAKQDALTITFEGDNEIIGKSSATLFNVASSCNTDIVINDGYYYSEVGNIFYGAADEETTTNFSEGKLIVNDGTFYKDNGNNVSMFACLGSYDIVIEGGFFHNAYNALIFGMSNGTTTDKGVVTFAAAPCSTEITINGGEFEIWYGWLYSDEHATNETKLTINDCYVMAESGVDYAGTARTATGIMRIGGKCEATINGGTFETEEFAAAKACDIIQTRHTANVTINDWTVYHRSGSESAIRVMGDATVVINGGWMESNARFVVRTMGGKNTTTAVTTPSKAILKVYGGTMILNPSHPKLSTSSSNCVIGNGGSTEFGHVYIYGGQFINKNDADPLTPDSAYARQVLGQINPFGDFEVHGGIMIATAAQDYFFFVDANTDADGVAIPTVNIPIVKGVTSTYEVDGRTYYYLAYGIGSSLLVPELQTSFDADITESGNGLKFTAVMDAVHYSALITWARSHAHVYNQQNGLAENDDAYKLVYGMLITTAEGLRKVGGIVDVDALREASAVCLDKYATATDALPNADGSLDISAVVENITVENNTVKYMAIPYVELTLGVGTADAVTERYYGEYNSNAGVASMASVAATLLRDNTDVMTGAYQYPSVTVKNAFNRYTVEQQNVLVTYLAHEHDFDNKGVCRDCGEDVAVALQEGTAELLYTEIGMVKFYKLSFKKDVTYSFGFTKNVVDYVLYDENGTTCVMTAGMYTPAEDGTYYLRVEGKRVGNTQMIVSHIHEADYLGRCAVCAQTLSTVLVPETKVEALFGENNFYFYNVALEANVNYSVALINGSFRLYDAQGNEQTITDSVFACTTAGTYYIVVEATYTGKGSIGVAHIHQYNHTGTCMVEYCGDDAGREISGVYKYTPAVKVMPGDKLFYSINMMAGVTYTLRSNQYIGVPALYNADGEAMALVADSFTCETAGTYYLVVDVQASANAQFRFDASHGDECTYNNKGECEFQHINSAGQMETVSCGNTSRTLLYDGTAQNVLMQAGQKYHFYFNYAGAGVSYLISLPVSGVNYTLYDADGNEIQVGVNYEQLIAYLPGVDANDDTRTADLYLDEDTDSILYLVVESTADEAQTVSISISHVHEIDHTGVCAVRDTTRNQNCSVYLRKQLEADRTTSVEYVAGELYYYELRLQKGAEYKVIFANYEDAVWAIYNAEGELLADSEQGDVFVCEADAYYYLVVAATQDSTGTSEAPTTITVQSHTHTLNNKGECSCGYANSAFIIDLDELAVQGGLKVGRLAAGKYYLRATMVAGKTYTLKFSISVGEVKSFQLYGGANADVEKTMTNGVFACEESGVYYYIVEITRSTAATDSIAYSVDGSVAHVHTFTSAYYYAEVEGKYYRIVDKCDEATCDASWSEEIAVLVADDATEIEYVTRGQYRYAIELEEGVTYAVAFANAEATWKLVTADGTEVANSENGTFLCEADGAYYLEVVATTASNDKHGAIATITVAAQ